MKRILAALLAVVFLCSGCSAENQAERAVTKMLNALQDGKLSKAASYTREDSLRLTGSGNRAQKFYKAMFGTIRYVVAGSVVEDGTADVIVKITMVNMKTVVSDATLEALESALGGGWNANKVLYDALMEQIASEDAESLTTTATACLIETEDGWKIDMEKSAKLSEAITGGLGMLTGP